VFGHDCIGTAGRSSRVFVFPFAQESGRVGDGRHCSAELVSSPRHVKRGGRISRTGLSCGLPAKGYETCPAGGALGTSAPTRNSIAARKQSAVRFTDSLFGYLTIDPPAVGTRLDARSGGQPQRSAAVLKLLLNSQSHKEIRDCGTRRNASGCSALVTVMKSPNLRDLHHPTKSRWVSSLIVVACPLRRVLCASSLSPDPQHLTPGLP
jgi:hypothetical protein